MWSLKLWFGRWFVGVAVLLRREKVVGMQVNLNKKPAVNSY